MHFSIQLFKIGLAALGVTTSSKSGSHSTVLSSIMWVDSFLDMMVSVNVGLNFVTEPAI